MEQDFSNFWLALSFIGSMLLKFFILMAIVLFILIFINLLLKRFNFSWSQKYVKKIDEIITSADGLKTVIKSFERLVNIIFNAFAAIINLFTLLVNVTFLSIDKVFLSPLEILITYLNKLGKRLESFNNDLKRDDSIETDVIDRETKTHDIHKKDEILNNIFDTKAKGKTDE